MASEAQKKKQTLFKIHNYDEILVVHGSMHAGGGFPLLINGEDFIAKLLASIL